MQTITFRSTSKAVIGTTKREPDGTIFVRGFASMKSPDRQGDIIDPLKFDIEQFQTNPQLYVNHKQWKRADGNGVNAGLVTEMHAVRVEKDKESDDADPTYRVLDLRTNDLITTLRNSDGFAVKQGDVGLWVVAHVMEPDVVDLVESKRLNSFSWQGSVFEKSSTGEVVNIDLREVSLVNIPAGQRSLFAVGKAFDTLIGALVGLEGDRAYIMDYEPTLLKQTDGPRYAVAIKDTMGERVMLLDSRVVNTAAEATAWATRVAGASAVVVLESTGYETATGIPVYRIPDGGILNMTEAVKEDEMTPEDRNLFKQLEAFKSSMSAGTPPGDTLAKEGGDEEMTQEDRELLQSLAKGISDVSAAQTKIVETQAALSARVSAVEATKAADDEEKAKAEAAEKEKALAEEKEKAAAEEKAKADETTVLLSEMAKSIKSISEGMDGMAKEQKALTERLDAIEAKPASKSAAADDDSDEELVKTTKQKFDELPIDRKRHVRRSALGSIMVPKQVVVSR